MSAVNTLLVKDASLHFMPTATGYDVQVITPGGVQVRIELSRAELEAASCESIEVLGTSPASFHAAGMRLQARLERIKK